MTIRILSPSNILRVGIVLLTTLAVLCVALFVSANPAQSATQCPPGFILDCSFCSGKPSDFCCDCMPVGDSSLNPVPSTVCANQPYEYNTMGEHYARRLWLFCFAPTTDDGQRIVWDVLCSGCTWSECQDHLASLGFSRDYEESIPQLIARGYWTEWGARGEVPFPNPACYSLAEPG